MKPAPYLYVVGKAAIHMQVRLAKLVGQAAKLFPNNDVQAWRWVQAKLYLDGRKPQIDIGIQRVDVSRVARQAPGVEATAELPKFLRRFVRQQ